MLDRRRAVAAMTALAALGACAPAHAGAGDLDPSFAQDGKVSLVSAGSFVARAVAVAPDGRIVVGGYTCEPGPSRNGLCTADGDSSFRIARFTRDGGLDTEWGDQGLVTAAVGTGRSQIFDLLVQPDGKVIAGGVARDDAGRDDFALARFDARGALDPAFGDRGVTLTRVGTDFSAIADLAAAPGGGVVAFGQARDDQDRQRMAIARYGAGGNVDGTFGSFGTVLAGSSGYGYALGGWVAPDGGIHAAGLAGDGDDPATFRNSVVRVEAGGTLSRAEEFPVGTSSSFANGLAGLPDGRWVSAGAATDPEGRQVMTLLRGLPGGGLDPGWDGDGMAMVRTLAGAVASDVALLPDGRVLAAGQATTGGGDHRFALARLDGSGVLDPAFGGGVVTTAWTRFPVARATALAVDAEGRALVAGIGCAGGTGTQCVRGTVHLALARYLADPPAAPRSAPPAADARPPFAKLRLPAALRRRTFARSGVRVRIEPDEEVAIAAQIKHGRRVVARRELPLAGGARTVALRVPARHRPRARRFLLRLEVRVTDRAGNNRLIRRSVRVRA